MQSIWQTITRYTVLLALMLASSAALAFDCEVTTPNMANPFGAAESSSTTHGWFGDEHLAALIPGDGLWQGMGPERNYFNKFWWWLKGYDARIEPNPELIINATRLNGDALNIVLQGVTSGYNQNWNAMLVGMEFPTAGCWQIVGQYQDRQLALIVEVGVRDEKALPSKN